MPEGPPKKFGYGATKLLKLSLHRTADLTSEHDRMGTGQLNVGTRSTAKPTPQAYRKVKFLS